MFLLACVCVYKRKRTKTELGGHETRNQRVITRIFLLLLLLLLLLLFKRTKRHRGAKQIDGGRRKPSPCVKNERANGPIHFQLFFFLSGSVLALGSVFFPRIGDPTTHPPPHPPPFRLPHFVQNSAFFLLLLLLLLLLFKKNNTKTRRNPGQLGRIQRN